MMAKRPTRAETTPGFRIKRIYEPAAADDGLRVLVDRLWPRGMSKEKAHIDAWLKEIAPSETLRHRFHDHAESWAEFVHAYRRELEQEPAATAATELREKAKHQPVTLLYAARDESHNNAVALKDWFERSHANRSD
jgi:uncharacterized protein YeaO (DUF488 family)